MTQQASLTSWCCFRAGDFPSLGEHCVGEGVAPTLRWGRFFPALLGLLAGIRWDRAQPSSFSSSCCLWASARKVAPILDSDDTI